MQFPWSRTWICSATDTAHSSGQSGRGMKIFFSWNFAVLRRPLRTRGHLQRARPCCHPSCKSCGSRASQLVFARCLPSVSRQGSLGRKSSCTLWKCNWSEHQKSAAPLRDPVCGCLEAALGLFSACSRHLSVAAQKGNTHCPEQTRLCLFCHSECTLAWTCHLLGLSRKSYAWHRTFYFQQSLQHCFRRPSPCSSCPSRRT